MQTVIPSPVSALSGSGSALSLDATGRSILDRMMADNPGKRFAVYKDGGAIAYWHSAGRWSPCVGKSILGGWMALGGEMFCNGEPLHRQEDWSEVAVLVAA